MRIVIQRVNNASITINEQLFSSIERGLMILVGIEDADMNEDTEWICSKICNLRIFPDENGVMNKNIKDAGGAILLVSQFTLHASTKKGNRPSYLKAARHEKAISQYQYLITQLEKELGVKIATGEFGAYMKVTLINDGPVTIVIDSKNRE
jgi:D-tyrosyl-tRNA(Tyr) deacylase